MLEIIPIPALHDNYIWMILHPELRQVIIVDPGEASPVINTLKRENLELTAILITHHHWDHTGGVKALTQQFENLPVYGASSIADITHPVKEGEPVKFDDFGCQFDVMEIPGHTLDHIAYCGEGALFCGDTLCTGGCGRVFEGTALQMLASLDRLAALPPDTQVYCGHEYTQANLRFANAVEPENPELQRRIEAVDARRSKHQPTVPAPLALELKTNPFLRVREPSIQTAAHQQCGKTLSDPVQVFTEIRRWKDTFA